MWTRLLTLPALALLAACTTSPAPATAPAMNGCDADAARSQIGRGADADTVEAARKAAGAALVRIIKPGQQVTMDFRGERLNVTVDDDNRILRFTCG